MGGGGKGSKSSYKNPVSITTLLEWVGMAAIRGYAGTNTAAGADLDMNKFMEIVPIETEQASGATIGHPNYKPFMVRRHGYNVGLPIESKLAYDQASALWWAWSQLQECFRVVASAKMQTLNDYHIDPGDTIAVEEESFGVRRLWLVEGTVETPEGVELQLMDVIGG